MIVKLLTEHNLEFLCFKGGCTGLSESTFVKMSHCLKSHVMAQLCRFVTGAFLFLLFSYKMLFCLKFTSDGVNSWIYTRIHRF